MRTIIIDDEPDNVELLAFQLARNCQQVEIVGRYTESTEGLEGIRSLKPTLVFLDIEMPVMNGFQLLKKTADLNFSVIFVTAYDQYAVQAFRFSALDYLLKPIDSDDLIAAVRRAENLTKINPHQLDMLRSYHPSTGVSLPDRVAMPHKGGLTFIELRQIIYCEADSNYTRFHLSNGEQYIISKTLGDVQEVLEVREFIRVHRQFMVNIHHIIRLIKGEGTYLQLTNGITVPVARQQKERLLERFGRL
ncbi:LytR/AlgR family response regulator transcription factor [Dyadobacter arcticus]|uniref:Two-component system LytT family response regulator n=1 Tax=Dyadobacter arcticus TaxID=1078754 RepID=A0ABX0UIM1_9BACT|nr:LytTR family DNA-binding domain-containing protein [Dyadobacter arcticus]NIJ52363.1 two-component system LytT family response regulator [Dyadobacter arcticus]